MRSISLLLVLNFFNIAWGQRTCIADIADIYAAEEAVTDLSVPRTYVLCPRRIFEMGRLDFDFNLKGFQVHPPLPLRSNMKIKCGDTGNRDELCWLAEGDLHMDATKYRGILDDAVENVEIEGIVFIGARRFSLWADKPGSITFRDCEWRDHVVALAPVMLDWFDADNQNVMLSVTFEDCLFHSNRFFGRGSQTAIIYANSAQNNVTVRKTIFEYNDMVTNNTQFETNSFIIETLGPLTIEESCFENNVVGVSNAVVFGNKFVDAKNHNSNSTGSVCEFAAVFETLQQFDEFTPLCVAGNLVSSCTVALGLATNAPTASPIALVTGTPTVTLVTGTPTVATLSPAVSPTPLIPETEIPVAIPPSDGSPSNFVWPSNSPTAVPVEETTAPSTAVTCSSGILTVTLLCFMGLWL